jgi:hypothetical protein
MGMIFVLFLAAALGLGKWDVLDKLLEKGVSNGVFPGAVAVVGNAHGVLYEQAVGSFTYGQIPPRNSNNPKMTVNTAFDMASCSKVMAATTAAAILYQQGYFDILDRVSMYLGPEFNANNKQEVRIVNLLTHDAGFPPDPGCVCVFFPHSIFFFSSSFSLFVFQFLVIGSCHLLVPRLFLTQVRVCVFLVLFCLTTNLYFKINKSILRKCGLAINASFFLFSIKLSSHPLDKFMCILICHSLQCITCWEVLFTTIRSV